MDIRTNTISGNSGNRGLLRQQVDKFMYMLDIQATLQERVEMQATGSGEYSDSQIFRP